MRSGPVLLTWEWIMVVFDTPEFLEFFFSFRKITRFDDFRSARKGRTGAFQKSPVFHLCEVRSNPWVFGKQGKDYFVLACLEHLDPSIKLRAGQLDTGSVERLVMTTDIDFSDGPDLSARLLKKGGRGLKFE